MNFIHRKRLFLILFLIIGLAAGVGCVLYALKQNINLFYTPSEIKENKASISQSVRVGGMVKKGSIQRGKDLYIQFTVTDFHKELVVEYMGILPDLFKEGQGVVMLGALKPTGIFQAYEVLAKHDETYMAPEVRAALDEGAKRNGV